MKTTKILATALTMTVIAGSMTLPSYAYSPNAICAQGNNNKNCTVTISGSNVNEIQSQLEKYGISQSQSNTISNVLGKQECNTQGNNSNYNTQVIGNANSNCNTQAAVNAKQDCTTPAVSNAAAGCNTQTTGNTKANCDTQTNSDVKSGSETQASNTAAPSSEVKANNAANASCNTPANSDVKATSVSSCAKSLCTTYMISNIQSGCAAQTSGKANSCVTDTKQSETGTKTSGIAANTADTTGTATNQENNNKQLGYQEQVVKLVNEERAKAGLAPLTMDTKVQGAALTRAKETVQSFSHTRPNGSSFSTVLTENNISFKGAGENIAWGQKSPEQVMDAWMNSAGHKANILNARYTTIGIGYYQDANGVNYWTQLFTY